MINRQGGKPLYLQVADRLRGRITRGEWAPGGRLPAEPDLAHEYEVGKDTVRAALAVLRHEGLVVTRRGYRAVVVEPVDKEIVVLEPGQQVDARMPTAAEREQHGLGEGVPVLVVVDRDGFGDLYPADRVRVVHPIG